jgi:hypothetical protein
MPEININSSTNNSVHQANTCENTVMNKNKLPKHATAASGWRSRRDGVTGAGKLPLVAWKACEQRFVWMSDFVQGEFHLTHEHALRHWQDGTALFLENAQRIVSNLAAQQGGF